MPSLDLIARFIGVDAGMGNEFNTMSKRADAASVSMGKFMKGSALALGALAVGSIKAAAEYQKLTVNLVTGAGEQQANLKMVQDGMLAMAGQVGFSADTLAKAMYLVESAGYHGAQALTVLKTAAEGAKVDNADLTTTVDALTSAMNAYHDPASQAAKVTNTLIATASVGKMHLQDYAAALGTVLPTAAALGVPLDQVGAAMATMTEQGTNAARAATYLRFAFSALANPSDKAQGAMESVGLTADKVATTLKTGGLPAVFAELQDAVGKKFPAGSAKYVASLANMVGGTRGLQAVLELTGSHLSVMNGNLAKIDTRVKSAGNSVSDWSVVQKNFNQQLDEMGAALQADAIRLGTDLLPVATELLHVLTDGGHVIADVAGFFEDNKVAAVGLGVALSAVLLPPLIEMAAWNGAAVLITAKAALLGLRDTAVEAAIAFDTAETATEGFTAALEAMNLNPVVLAITAVIAASYLLERRLGSGAKTEFAAGQQAADRYAASLNQLHYSLGATTTTATDLGLKLQAAAKSFGSGNIDKHVGQVVALEARYKGAEAALVSMQSNLKQLNVQYNLSATEVQRLAKLNGIDLSKSYQQVSSEILNAASPTSQLTTEFTTLAHSASGSANSVTALSNAINTLLGNFLGVKQAQLTFHTDMVTLDADLKKSKGSLDENTKAGSAARAQYLETAGALSDVANAMEKNGAPAAAIKAEMEKLLGAFARTPAGGRLVTQTLQHIESFVGSMNLETELSKVGQSVDDGLEQGINRNRQEALNAATLLGAQVAKNVATAAGVASPSWKTAYVGKMLAEGLIQGWTGEAAKIKDAMSTTVQDSLDNLDTKLGKLITKDQSAVSKALSNYRSLASAQKSAISSLKQSITGSVDISSLFGQDANGNATVGNLGSYLSGSVGPIRTEASDLKKLRKMGLSQYLLSQLSGLPPAQAVQLMAQILSGQDGSVASLNKSSRLINRYAGISAGTVVKSPAEQHQLALAHDAVKAAREQLREQKQTNRWLETMAALLVAQNSTYNSKTKKFDYSDPEIKAIIKGIRRINRAAGSDQLSIGYRPN